jgi:hypothetical protein
LAGEKGFGSKEYHLMVDNQLLQDNPLLDRIIFTKQLVLVHWLVYFVSFLDLDQQNGAESKLYIFQILDD